MDKTTRPTNYDEIIPWLQARCEGVQREPEHDAHVLLGAASVIIAEAHSEIARLLKLSKELSTDRVCEACGKDWRGSEDCPVCGHVNEVEAV